MLFAGCLQPQGMKTGPENAASPNTQRAAFPSSKAATNPPPPTLRALDGLNGRLASVNQRLKFVVIDYSLNAVPPIDTRLAVVRSGQKVGFLKLTGPVQG